MNLDQAFLLNTEQGELPCTVQTPTSTLKDLYLELNYTLILALQLPRQRKAASLIEMESGSVSLKTSFLHNPVSVMCKFTTTHRYSQEIGKDFLHFGYGGTMELKNSLKTEISCSQQDSLYTVVRNHFSKLSKVYAHQIFFVLIAANKKIEMFALARRQVLDFGLILSKKVV